MKIKKQNLLLIASLVWFIAGLNILNIGIRAYKSYLNFFNVFLSILVFSFFWFIIFKKLVLKHSLRIKSFKDEFQFFLKFFDKKSFIMMFFMMSLGILIRKFHLVSDLFIAIFYSGLGFSLFLAGVSFGINYLKFYKEIRNNEKIN